MPVPAPGTYPPYFERYVSLVQADSVTGAIQQHSADILQFFNSIPGEKIEYRYAEGKWSIKEMLQHIIDTERIFGYRALRIARHDQTPLPGFDEVSYAANSNAEVRTWESLLEEFAALRRSTDLLLANFTADQLQQSGTTNEHRNTANAISFMIFGHILHHINVIKERYF